MRSCWFFWQHRWAKWFIVVVPWTRWFNNDKHGGLREFQQRECLKCGLRQRKTILNP